MRSDLASFAARLRECITSSIHRSCSETEFKALALELFRLHFAHNLTYRRICDARGAKPDKIGHWSEIPAVPASAFKEFDLTCLAPDERTTVFHSSGTTGQQPSRHFHNAESLAIYEASLWPWFAQHLLSDWEDRAPDFRLVCLTPPLAQAPNSSLIWMLDSVRRRLNAPETAFVGRIASDGQWALDFDVALDHLAVDSRRQTPDARLLLLGTAFSFVHLLDGLADRKLRLQLPSGSCVMETGGYKGRSRELPKDQLHALITQRLGIPASHIVCEYGMSELSSQAYDGTVEFRSAVLPHPGPLPKERGNRGQSAGVTSTVGYFNAGTIESVNSSSTPRCFHFPPWARVQIVSPETGREVGHDETGLIRVFDLANVYSVLAIQTEDLAIRRDDGFDLLGRAADAEPRGCSLMPA